MVVGIYASVEASSHCDVISPLAFWEDFQFRVFAVDSTLFVGRVDFNSGNSGGYGVRVGEAEIERVDSLVVFSQTYFIV